MEYIGHIEVEREAIEGEAHPEELTLHSVYTLYVERCVIETEVFGRTHHITKTVYIVTEAGETPGVTTYAPMTFAALCITFEELAPMAKAYATGAYATGALVAA